MRQPAADVLVIGAGGHALVVIEVLRAAGSRVVGCVSPDGRPGADLARLDVEMVGTSADVADLIAGGVADVFAAVGDNRARRLVADDVAAAGGRLASAVSPHAVVSPTADIGAGVLVMPGAVINAQATIAIGAIVNTNASVDHECRVGAFAHLAPRAVLAGRVTIGDGALVGVGACVTPGRTVGAWSTVGAGGVVVSDVPADVVVAGVPAVSQFGTAVR